MKVSAKQRKGYAHSLTAGHHTLIADEPEDKGGSDTGPRPTQLLALSLASCTAITIEMYASRKGWKLGGLEVEVDHDPAPAARRTRFEVVIKLPDRLSDEQVQQLLEIAHKCPVHRILKGEVEIEDRVSMGRERADTAPPT
jgi:putative redox protein